MKWAIVKRDRHGRDWFWTGDGKWSDRQEKAEWSARKDVMDNSMQHDSIVEGANVVDLERLSRLSQCRTCKKLYLPDEMCMGELCIHCDHLLGDV